MPEKKKQIRMIAVTLLLFFTFSNPCHSTDVCESPQWLKRTIEASHPILAQDREIWNRDFSFILADRRTDFIGYMGDDYFKTDICFHTIKKGANACYLITGSSKAKTDPCTFAGSVQILDIRELNDYEYGADDFMEGKIKKQGVCIGRYCLEEDRKQKDSGIFSGISLFRWYIDNNNQLHYDDINDDSDSYSNNQFAGTWRSYSTGKEEKCAWGHFRVPDSGNLDIGVAEFSVNPTYAKNGWNGEGDPSGQRRESISEYSCMPPDIVGASYKIISKESGYYYCISINGKEYRISDMIDYGDPDLKVYTNHSSGLLLIGLIDFYASVYFVYYFKNNVLARLGQIDIEQPDDVEVHGVRKVSFKVYSENGKIVVKSYLDGVYRDKSEFLLISIPGTEK